MELETAVQIIADNYKGENNSFIYYLHEKNLHAEEAFWELYDSIAALTLCGAEKSIAMTEQIAQIYHRFLKYIIFHFDPNDAFVLENFPQNYVDYLERMEYALMAYSTGSIRLISHNAFALQKPEQQNS